MDVEITVTPLSGVDEVILTVDGQDGAELRPGDRLVVRRGDATVPLVRFAGQNFFATLRRKLHWGLEYADRGGARRAECARRPRRLLNRPPAAPVASRMLTELRIRDFAVIDRSSPPGPGLNVLTGETGAGKSIIVGALSLLLGERASSDVVRTGRRPRGGRGRVRREPTTPCRTRSWRARHRAGGRPAHPAPRDRGGGRGRVWVNGAASTVALLGELGAFLVDLHGQHEHQSLLQPRQQRALLDAYADATDLAPRCARSTSGCGRARSGWSSWTRGPRDRAARRLPALPARGDRRGRGSEPARRRSSRRRRRLEHAGELAASPERCTASCTPEASVAARWPMCGGARAARAHRPVAAAVAGGRRERAVRPGGARPRDGRATRPASSMTRPAWTRSGGARTCCSG
jgi:energy-coupling factor transporter ATP-binding protein EcfA2